MNSQPQKIQEIIERGVEKVYPSKAFLRTRLLSGKPLKLYAGIDPTAPSFHIGHLAILNKLAQFQKLGHQVFLLIGDFTALIGDPTGRSSTRPQLTKKEILNNSRAFKKQAERILSFQSPNPARIVYNSAWLSKLTLKDLVQLASHFTVQQMITRDMFQRRIAKKKPIFLHEFLYPAFQAYDSIALEVDLEVGGNDQTFNMLCGRSLVKDLQKREKIVLAVQLLVNPDGSKMSKTATNSVFLNDSPLEMFGKIMSYPDSLIEPGFSLCTQVSWAEVKKIKVDLKEKKINPRDAKFRLAKEIVTISWGTKKAEQAAQEFQRIFQQKAWPSEIPEIKLTKKRWPLIDLLIQTHLATSRSEARRLITQGGIKINRQLQKDPNQVVEVSEGTIIQRGRRRFVKIC